MPKCDSGEKKFYIQTPLSDVKFYIEHVKFYPEYCIPRFVFANYGAVLRGAASYGYNLSPI
jgi:hypothetical protein